MAVVLGVGGLLLYPGEQELPTPAPTRLVVEQATTKASAGVPVTFITYSVERVGPALSVIDIGVVVAEAGHREPLGGFDVFVRVELPIGAAIRDCIRPNCDRFQGQYTWTHELTTNTRGTAETTLTVDAPDFGYVAGGTYASVAIPAVNYLGPGRPSLQARYYITSADHYDWASFPATYTSGFAAEWSEPVVGGGAQGGALVTTRAAAGVDHEKQHESDLRTFLAGAAIALAGAALIAALQEVRRASTKPSP